MIFIKSIFIQLTGKPKETGKQDSQKNVQSTAKNNKEVENVQKKTDSVKVDSSKKEEPKEGPKEEPKPEELKTLKETFLNDVTQVSIEKKQTESNKILSEYFSLFFPTHIVILILLAILPGVLPQSQEVKESPIGQFKEHIKVMFKTFNQFKNLSTKEISKDILQSVQKYLKCVVFVIPDSKEKMSKQKMREEISKIVNKKVTYVYFPDLKIYADNSNAKPEELILSTLPHLLIHSNRNIFLNLSFCFQNGHSEIIYDSFLMMMIGVFGEGAKSYINSHGFNFLIMKEEFTDTVFNKMLESMFLECMAIYNACKNDKTIRDTLVKILNLKLLIFDMKKMTEDELLAIMIITYVMHKTEENLVFM